MEHNSGGIIINNTVTMIYLQLSMLMERNIGVNTVSTIGIMTSLQLPKLMEDESGGNIINYIVIMTYPQSFGPMGHKNGGAMVDSSARNGGSNSNNSASVSLFPHFLYKIDPPFLYIS